MERYVLNLKRRYFFSENYATVPSRKGFGFKNRNFGEILLGQRGSKAIF
jgi:hypothetical protein